MGGDSAYSEGIRLKMCGSEIVMLQGDFETTPRLSEAS